MIRTAISPGSLPNPQSGLRQGQSGPQSLPLSMLRHCAELLQILDSFLCGACRRRALFLCSFYAYDTLWLVTPDPNTDLWHKWKGTFLGPKRNRAQMWRSDHAGAALPYLHDCMDIYSSVPDSLPLARSPGKTTVCSFLKKFPKSLGTSEFGNFLLYEKCGSASRS